MSSAGLEAGRAAAEVKAHELAERAIADVSHKERQRGVSAFQSLRRAAFERRARELQDAVQRAREEHERECVEAERRADEARRGHAAKLSKKIDATLNPIAKTFLNVNDAKSATAYLDALHDLDLEAKETVGDVLSLERVVAPLFRADGGEDCLGDRANWFGRTDGGPRGAAAGALFRIRQAWELGQTIAPSQARAHMTTVAEAVAAVIGYSRFRDAARARVVVAAVTTRDMSLALDAHERSLA